MDFNPPSIDFSSLGSEIDSLAVVELVFLGVVAALMLVSLILFVTLIVSILRSGLNLGPKFLWVIFSFWIPVAAWFMWYLLGRPDARRRAEVEPAY